MFLVFYAFCSYADPSLFTVIYLDSDHDFNLPFSPVDAENKYAFKSMALLGYMHVLFEELYNENV